MKKTLLLLAALLALPLASQADVSIGVNVPGLSLHIGDRDNRGHYWDGYRWRDRDYWRKHYYYHEGRYRKYDRHYDKHHWKKEKKHHHDHDRDRWRRHGDDDRD